MSMTVMVTGATGGIGRAVVGALDARGHRVLAVGRSSQRLAELCSSLANTSPLVVDFTRDEPPPTPVETLDALIHCAGVAEVASVEDTPEAVWQETLAVNLTGPAALTRALLPALRAARGRVVFVNAAADAHATPRWSAYTASKSGLRELADSLREEEAPHGIRVTSIYPGGIRTELLRAVREQFGAPFDPARTVSPESFASVVLGVLEFPADAHLMEVTMRAAPGPAG
jgi:NADP-dependent 3-hydroxy acid dehydrogenase YdfG